MATTHTQTSRSRDYRNIQLSKKESGLIQEDKEEEEEKGEERGRRTTEILFQRMFIIYEKS